MIKLFFRDEACAEAAVSLLSGGSGTGSHPADSQEERASSAFSPDGQRSLGSRQPVPPLL